MRRKTYDQVPLPREGMPDVAPLLAVLRADAAPAELRRRARAVHVVGFDLREGKVQLFDVSGSATKRETKRRSAITLWIAVTGMLYACPMASVGLREVAYFAAGGVGLGLAVLDLDPTGSEPVH